MRTLLDMAISVDGYVAAPGGADAGLYEWYSDPPAASVPIVNELVDTTGAIVIGRGAYDAGGDNGWDDSPYSVPHIVITHRPPVPPPDRRVDFIFAGNVIEAMGLATVAAGDRWVAVGGGADIARQLLAGGLVDELQLHVVPVILGAGMRLFEPSTGAHLLRVLRVVESVGVTHLRYAVGPVHGCGS